MVVVATGMGAALHRSPRIAESFLIKWRAFLLVPPDGGLLVELFNWLQKLFRPSDPDTMTNTALDVLQVLLAAESSWMIDEDSEQILRSSQVR